MLNQSVATPNTPDIVFVRMRLVGTRRTDSDKQGCGERVSTDRTSALGSFDFTADDLHRVRGLVAEAGPAAGLSQTVTDNLVGAVNEIVVNACLHAGGRGRLTITQTPDGIWVEVADAGAGLPAGVSGGLPAVTAGGGRGLWLARQMSHRMVVSSSPAGTTVRLFAGPGVR